MRGKVVSRSLRVTVTVALMGRLGSGQQATPMGRRAQLSGGLSWPLHEDARQEGEREVAATRVHFSAFRVFNQLRILRVGFPWFGNRVGFQPIKQIRVGSGINIKVRVGLLSGLTRSGQPIQLIIFCFFLKKKKKGGLTRAQYSSPPDIKLTKSPFGFCQIR